MRRRTLKIFLLLSVLSICAPGARRPRTELNHNEVIVGAQVWGYSRVYPLLDGLLLDWLSNQINALSLNSSTANATNIDAIQQALQVQLQYNQLAGVQNAANAQLTSSNLAYQTTLAQQAAALLPQISTAVTNVSQAQSTLNALNASNASAAQITAATAALTSANTTLTALNSQLSALKAFPAPTPAAPGTNLLSNTSPNLPAFNSSAIPTSVIGNAGNVATGNNGPTFPPTKQMDNQMNLLWERMARAVGVMVKPDSLDPNDNVYLISLDTGIYPVERKKQLLDVSFSLNCTDSSANGASVLGLYPRSAAININEDKYRDTSFGIGAVLNFFGIGSTVAYNREHLKASQSLGESSYITGHGIGLAKFGWVFGIGLGDDSISPGIRTTFALVRANPQTCKGLNVSIDSEIWEKPPHFRAEADSLLPPEKELSDNKVSDKRVLEESRATADKHTSWPLSVAATAPCQTNCIQSIDFNRNEYTAGKAQVTLTLNLNMDMDQQQTVTVNGVFIPRLRDSFGRASTTASGVGTAALETNGNFAGATTNQWILTNPRTMLMTLDASLFGNHFPEILLNSPSGPSINVLSQVAASGSVKVSGRSLSCDKLAASGVTAPQPFFCIPSLGFPQATLTNVGVARWISSGGVDRLSITPVSASSANAVNSPTGVPTIQVVSDVANSVWGSDAEVDLLDAGNIRPLHCAQDYGTRLLCDAPDRDLGSKGRPSVSLQIIDQNHQGGPIKAFVSTAECGTASSRNCAPPLLWQLTPPLLISSQTPGSDGHPDLTKTSWNVSFKVVNVDNASTATLSGPATGASPFKGTVTCDESPLVPCTVSFTVMRNQLGLMSDSMTLTVTSGTISGRSQVANLFANMKPILGGIAADFTSWFGQNLVYNDVLVGTTITKVECDPDGTGCVYAKSAANVKNNPWDATGGLMYFIGDSGLPLPFIQTNPTGPNINVSLDPSKVWAPPKPASVQGAGGGAPATPPPPPLPSPVPGVGTPSVNPSVIGPKVPLGPGLSATTTP